MLPDYEIQQRPNRSIIFLEFILILIIFQSAIFLFLSPENEEAIQFRILAHSNTTQDQLEKEKVQQAVMPLVQEVIDEAETKSEAITHLRELEPLILETAQAIVPEQIVTLNRDQAMIPPKRSGFFIQPQANYDTYLLTIGSGRGDNWWCALFENICYPEKDEKEEEKVTFFIWEWIKGLFP